MRISAKRSVNLGLGGLYQLKAGLQECGREQGWFAKRQIIVGEDDGKTVLWANDGAVQ